MISAVWRSHVMLSSVNIGTWRNPVSFTWTSTSVYGSNHHKTTQKASLCHAKSIVQCTVECRDIEQVTKHFRYAVIAMGTSMGQICMASKVPIPHDGQQCDRNTSYACFYHSLESTSKITKNSYWIACFCFAIEKTLLAQYSSWQSSTLNTTAYQGYVWLELFQVHQQTFAYTLQTHDIWW